MKTIRVAFVMGGGVSLGSFSGGALGQCIQFLSKLNECSHDLRIEIDVLAGASAGSLTLGLMLHTLCNPNLDASELNNVKKMQHEAWVKQISMSSLAAEPKGGWNSLLNREAVDTIARNMLRWHDGDVPNQSLFGNRVLFTCSLVNLNGLGIDASDDVSSLSHLIGRKGLIDPLTITQHKDSRTFDLQFAPGLSQIDTRFRVIDMRLNTGWMEIAGTAVASGAFPFAFEPVSLLRYKHEYDPIQTRDWRSYHFRNQTQIDSDGPTLMCYADGGIMDNEPLEQALEHCRLLDFDQNGKRLPNIQRLIIYIDPFADGHLPVRKLKIHSNVTLHEDQSDIRYANTFTRLVGQAGSIINALKKSAIGRQWLKNPDAFLSGYTAESLMFLGVGPFMNRPGEDTIQPVSLAGKELSGFKGFLDIKYRDHDFRWGEYLADHWLQKAAWLASNNGNDQTSELEQPDNQLPEPQDAEGFEKLLERINALIDDDRNAIIKLGFGIVFLKLGIKRSIIKDNLIKAMKTTSKEDQDDVIEIDFIVTALPHIKNFYMKIKLNGTFKRITDERSQTITSRCFVLPVRINRFSGTETEFASPHIRDNSVELRIIQRPSNTSEVNTTPYNEKKTINLDNAKFKASLNTALKMVNGRICIVINWNKGKVIKMSAEETLIPWTEMP